VYVYTQVGDLCSLLFLGNHVPMYSTLAWIQYDMMIHAYVCTNIHTYVSCYDGIRDALYQYKVCPYIPPFSRFIISRTLTTPSTMNYRRRRVEAEHVMKRFDWLTDLTAISCVLTVPGKVTSTERL
jgi:hypothetical protein